MQTPTRAICAQRNCVVQGVRDEYKRRRSRVNVMLLREGS